MSAADHLRRHRSQLGRTAMFALMVLLATIAAIRLTSLVVAIAFGQVWSGSGVHSEPVAWSLASVVIASAEAFAWMLFAASALSLPMVADAKAELVPALITSLKAVVQQPGPMLLWTALISVLTLTGIASLLVGLIRIFPVLAT